MAKFADFNFTKEKGKEELNRVLDILQKGVFIYGYSELYLGKDEWMLCGDKIPRPSFYFVRDVSGIIDNYIKLKKAATDYKNTLSDNDVNYKWADYFIETSDKCKEFFEKIQNKDESCYNDFGAYEIPYCAKWLYF